MPEWEYGYRAQGETMTSKRPLEPKDLYRLRLISDAQINPVGTRVAFVLKQMDEEKNDYVSNIYVVDLEGNLSQFSSGEKDSAPRWSPDGKRLAFLSGRKDKQQLYVLRTDGGESPAATDRKDGAGVAVWSPDSRFIAFTAPVSDDADDENDDEKENAGKEKEEPAKTKITSRAGYKLDGTGYIGNKRRHIFVLDVASGELSQITEGDKHNDNPSWAPDGEHLAFNSNRDPDWDISTESHIFVARRDGSELKQLTRGSAFSGPVFSPDGRCLAVVGTEDPAQTFGPTYLYTVSREGGEARREGLDDDINIGYHLLSDVVSSDVPIGLTWTDGGIYFLGSRHGECDVYRSTGDDIQHLTEGRHAVTGFSASKDGTIAYTKATSVCPAEVFIRSGRTDRQLTRENEAFLEEVFIQQPERLSYPGAQDEDGDAWLLPPKDGHAGSHPLIVYVHGGPMLAYGELMFFEHQFLAGQGFGVFFPNIHGSATYGASYHNSIMGRWGTLDFEDVMNGTEHVIQRDWVDTSRLGIVGGSYGGYMTSWVMGHSDRFKCGITERCLCNWISFFGTSDGAWSWNRVTGAYPEDDLEKLWDMSPIKYVRNIKAPLMVMHSEGDDRTPIGQGEEMFNALRRNAVDTKFVAFPEESHGLTRMGKPSRRVERLGYILDWFRQKL
jgi:dipeptidyl aminopeptidase/acylaminoacyl peptidase